MSIKFLTVEETAEYLRIPKTKAYELVKSEGFPSLKIGKLWRVDLEKLSIWIDGKIANKVI